MFHPFSPWSHAARRLACVANTSVSEPSSARSILSIIAQEPGQRIGPGGRLQLQANGFEVITHAHCCNQVVGQVALRVRSRSQSMI